MLRIALLAAIVVAATTVAWSGEPVEDAVLADETKAGRDADRARADSSLTARTAQLEVTELDEHTRRLLLRRAARERKEMGPIGRGFHGLWNMVIAPLEIPATILGEMNETDNAIEGVIKGTLGGVGNFAIREIAGIAEVFTVFSFKKSQPLYDRKLGEPGQLARPWQ